MQITNGSTPAILILMVSSTDSKTVATGKTVSVQISKAGGAFAAATNAVSEISLGFYKVALTATETDTNGALAVIATATGCDVWRDIHEVTA